MSPPEHHGVRPLDTLDTILFEGGDSNLYGYVLNDPVNLVDPDGFMAMRIPQGWRGLRFGPKTRGPKFNPKI